MARHRKSSKKPAISPAVARLMAVAGWAFRIAWVIYALSQHLP
ncbi:hypothetical protein Ae717Ps2_6618 [Pseudonocardia sp. Ae717_Ps2]|nr:hypothetical protein [Pseudonocardia sp. Ae717_Ps2]OLM28279.1 hypothetical protein Ae717Ps2_6618 [Pseudonocardia sp. Ae717_Ps2]